MTRHPGSKPNPRELRDCLLGHFRVLRIPITSEQFDAVIARAEREHLSHLDFLEALIAEQAHQRRERGIQHRIREARFREPRNLETFDWKFNAPTIDRLQIEELATSDFIRRKDNLVMVGQSGVGKSHIMQALGRRACTLGYRVRYTTSAALLKDLTASLADQTGCVTESAGYQRFARPGRARLPPSRKRHNPQTQRLARVNALPEAPPKVSCTRPDLARTSTLLQTLRPADHRRVWFRQDRTR
ncbi:MAG: ATP-binding protein [Planctomycetota bacterium]